MASLISIAVTFTIHSFSRHNWRVAAKECLFLLTGFLISAAPMVLYLFFKGAFIPFIGSLYGFPRLTMLGYGGIPAPTLKDFASKPLGPSLFYYWVILFYSLVALYVASSLLLGKINRDNLLKLSILVFGVLLFVVAVRRYSQMNVAKVFLPCIILTFLFFDDAVMGIIVRKGFLRARHGLFLFLLSAAVLLLLSRSVLRMNFRQSLENFHYKWTRVRTGYSLPFIKRGGIFFDPVTAKSLARLYKFLNAHTAPGDYVYFFPNEAAYYFLLNRNNPTRFAISYFAITKRQREELVRELEKNKPAYVVYSKNTGRIDNIPEYVQVPEVVKFLKAHYDTYLDMGNILIMKRIGATNP